jgi:hypothetical protein
MMCRAASGAFDVIPVMSKTCLRHEAGTHAPIVMHAETCVGARLRGHDTPGGSA